jgi:hypothetical protein
LATIDYSFGAIAPLRFDRTMRTWRDADSLRRNEMKYGDDEWSRSDRVNFVMDIVALIVIGLLIVATAAFCLGMLP